MLTNERNRSLKNHNMNYLSLDYGTKQIGVALATGPLAEPLTTFPTPKALDQINPLINTYTIKAIIIGIPQGPAQKPAQNFAKQLEVFNIPIYAVDETLSSHDARKSLSHTSRTKRKTQEHAAAAAIILQSWLDSRPPKR